MRALMERLDNTHAANESTTCTTRLLAVLVVLEWSHTTQRMQCKKDPL